MVITVITATEDKPMAKAVATLAITSSIPVKAARYISCRSLVTTIWYAPLILRTTGRPSGRRERKSRSCFPSLTFSIWISCLLFLVIPRIFPLAFPAAKMLVSYSVVARRRMELTRSLPLVSCRRVISPSILTAKKEVESERTVTRK